MIQVLLPFDHRQLLENSGVFTMERLNVDVVPPDSHKGQEKNISIDRVCSLDTTILQLVSLVCELFDRSHQVVAADGRNYELNCSVKGKQIDSLENRPEIMTYARFK